MNRVGHWATTLAVAAAAGVGFMALLVWSSPRAPGESLVSGYGVTMAVLSTPWALAVGILWHAWWVRAGFRLSAMDAPARLLATAVATLPAERRDWGAAMTAELTQVPDRRARWRFAAGCARAAVLPPQRHPLWVLTTAALATTAAIVVWLAVGDAVPTMRVFAVTFVVLVGALATAAVARSRRLHRPRHGALLTIAGLVGVAACIAVTAYNLRTDRSESLASSPAITLAVVLAACLWLTLAPPRALTTSRRARWVGVGVGLVLGPGVFLAARLNETNSDGGVLIYLLNLPIVFGVASALVAVVDRSFSAGLQTTVWALMVTSLLSFAVFVLESLRWYQLHQTSLLDGDAGNGQLLHAAIFWVLIAIPVLAFPCGVIGAGLGALGARVGGAAGRQPATAGQPPMP